MYNSIINSMNLILFISVCYFLGRVDRRNNNYTGYIIAVINIIITEIIKYFLGV